MQKETVLQNKEENGKVPFPHQEEALRNLSIVFEYEQSLNVPNALSDEFRDKIAATILNIPVGGGKTYTAVIWLLKEWIDKGYKAIWIAPSNELIKQAYDCFKEEATNKNLPSRGFTSCSVLGTIGQPMQELSVDVPIILSTYQYMVRHIEDDEMKEWVSESEKVMLVIDEAHHSASRGHVHIINSLKGMTNNLGILGLTATPYRGNKGESGALKQIFTDGVNSSTLEKDSSGICYSISLLTLINRGYLAKPIVEDVDTNVKLDYELGFEALNKLVNFDEIPEEIAADMAKNLERNNKIVTTYIENKDRYKQTIFFCVNCLQAINLHNLLESQGIKSGLAISGSNKLKDVDVSRETVEANIQSFRNGEIDVLLTCRMLAEGFDVPNTKTVFLTRPTTSKIALTQCVGRALRKKEEDNIAYIVNFIDDWTSKISWVAPQELLEGKETSRSYSSEKETCPIPTSYPKILKLLGDLERNLDTNKVSTASYSSVLPVGMYYFDILEENGDESSHQILVYSSTCQAYNDMLARLPEVFADFNIGDLENIPRETLEFMALDCKDRFFQDVKQIPPVYKDDIADLLRYYAMYDCVPTFVPISQDAREELDLSVYAKYVVDTNMIPTDEYCYLDNLWENKLILKNYYTKKTYFERLYDMEKRKYLKELRNAPKAIEMK